MSFINFLRHGVQVDNNHHNRFNDDFPQDKAVAMKHTCEFNGKVIQTEDAEKVSICWIDGSVEVTSVSSALRQPNLKFWEDKKVNALVFAGIQTALTVGGAGLMVGASVATAGAIPMAVAGVALVVTGLSLAVLGLVRANQASKQIKAWQDPTAKFSQMRQQIGIQDFLYIIDNGLKGTLVHPEEVKQQWIKWADSFFSQYTNAPSVNHIKQFFELNPFGATYCYAWGDTHSLPKTIEHIEVLNSTFCQAKRKYKTLRNSADKQRKDIHNRKKELLDNNEKNRQAALKPAQMLRDYYYNQAESTFKEAVKVHQAELTIKINKIKNDPKKVQEAQKLIADANNDFKKHPAVVKAQADLTESRTLYTALYQLAIMPIKSIFDSKNAEINQWSASQIKRITTEENQGIIGFSNIVSEISKSYLEGKTCDYSPYQSNQTVAYPNVETPDFDRFYAQPPAYNPAWAANGVNENHYHQFFQKLPQYR